MAAAMASGGPRYMQLRELESAKNGVRSCNQATHNANLSKTWSRGFAGLIPSRGAHPLPLLRHRLLLGKQALARMRT